MIAQVPELWPLTEILAKEGDLSQRHTIEQYMKIASARRSELNKAIDAIPIRIDEAEKAMPDLTDLSLEAAERAIAAAIAKKQERGDNEATISLKLKISTTTDYDAEGGKFLRPIIR